MYINSLYKGGINVNYLQSRSLDCVYVHVESSKYIYIRLSSFPPLRCNNGRISFQSLGIMWGKLPPIQGFIQKTAWGKYRVSLIDGVNYTEMKKGEGGHKKHASNEKFSHIYEYSGRHLFFIL